MEYLELIPSDSSEGEEDSEEDSESEDDEDDEEDTEVEDHPRTSPRRHLLNGNAVNFVASEELGREIGNNISNVAAAESECEVISTDAAKAGVNDGASNNPEEENTSEIDGLCCPICFDAWSSGGDHHVCCLPCGHIYGLSCIKKWLLRRGSSKCPQCKKRCVMKDIRLLYASRIVTVDGKLQNVKIQSLEAKCMSLEKKNADLSKKEVQSKKRESDLYKQVCYLKDRTRDLEALVENMEHRVSGPTVSSCNYHGEFASGYDDIPKLHTQGCSNKFVMQKDIQVDGARLFDIDSSSQIFVIARRLSGMAGMHVLTKISLLFNNEMEDIVLPANTKAVKDLRVSPHARLVLLASLGKKLSVFSTESNNIIINYDLPAAAWSCSWDISSSHYVYAGLQNGALLQFDLRHTMRPVESLTGLTENPIHTLESLPPDSSLGSGLSSVLSASSLGLCQWNFGGCQERPYLIPDSDNQGVCISLAYGPTSNDIVASYRPKIEMSREISQPTLTYASSSATGGQWVQGTHVQYKKTGCSRFEKLGVTCANVSNVRLPRSAILEGLSENPWFASADEATCELVLQELPSLTTVGHLKARNYPVLDLKYSRISNSALFGCLSGDGLQLFTAKLF